jgi:hypothetical protein
VIDIRRLGLSAVNVIERPTDDEISAVIDLMGSTAGVEGDAR